jgi:hypothetical protein
MVIQDHKAFFSSDIADEQHKNLLNRIAAGQAISFKSQRWAYADS